MKTLRKFLPITLGGSRDGLFSLLFERAQGFDRREYGSHLRELILRMEKAPTKLMEIGVEDGLGAEVMIKAAKKRTRKKIEYYGFDLFGEIPKKTGMLEKIRLLCRGDNREEIREKLERLGCKCYLYRGDSTRVLPRVLPNLPKMDFIHIDGGHDYETVKADWNNASRLMNPNTVVVFDDYPLEGVKKVVREIKRSGRFKVIVSGGHAVVTKKSRGT